MDEDRGETGRRRDPRVDLSVVVPVHNEAANLGPLLDRLVTTLERDSARFEVLFVDDGSRDDSPALLDRAAREDARVGVLTLSRNFGHQAAVTAGLDHAEGRAVVVMDGDLQDPPEVIPTLLDRWRAGYDVAYAVRRTRREVWPKRLAYFGFYRILGAVADLDIPLDSGDFCLMDRKVVDALRTLPERARFVRGLRTFVGFRQVGVPYDRDPRHLGEPKYTFRALLTLAVDGIISFSGRPLRLLTYLGLATATLAVGLTGWVFLDAFVNQTAPRGWASVIVAVLFMGSMQMVGLGIVGEYVRLIFLETKGRPSYIMSDHRPAAGSVAPRARTPARPHLRVDRPVEPA